MSSTVKAGLLLAGLVLAWTFGTGFAGLHTNLLVTALFPVIATVFTIAAVIWGLRATARSGNGYGAQVLAGLTIGLVASMFIFLGSLLFTMVVFPDYFQEIQAAGAEVYAGMGMSEADVQAAMEANAASQTPLWQALLGVIGTMVTTLVVSLITAIFVRAK